MSRNRWKYLVRLGVSLGVLAIVYMSVDLAELPTVLGRVSWQGALLVLVLYTVSQLLSAIKWQIFLREAGVRRSLRLVIRAYFFGMFVNTFGLGTLGGDVARGMLLKPARGRRAAALATVVADRLHGLLTLSLLAGGAILMVHPEHLTHLALLLVIASAVTLIGSWWFGPQLLTRIFPAEHRFGTAARNAAAAFPRSATAFGAATVVSLCSHVLQILVHVVIAHDLHAEIGIGYLFATVPVVNIAASIPVTINGLGVREAMYVLLFTPAGISRELAVAFGAIWVVSVTLVGALGGFLLPTGAIDETDSDESEATWANEELALGERNASC
ncbi:MAG: flippase-like domain-containing protein [Bdellovibrionales bacterium]|nr:flippase-like domain-containing protein [Bdellovibrionales bacterium]